MLTAALLWSFGLAEPGSKELTEFVSRPDPSYSWKRKTVMGHPALELVSQTWQGVPWRHDVVVVRPDQPVAQGAAIIEVTGWDPNEKDFAYAKMLADSSGLPVAILFHIPNQPLYEREEDDLVAHTFERFFETGDPSWPLLFPMVKSVSAAMDALREAEGVEKFVVTGASKRGWTTWLVGSLGDPRVVGIAPAVFDNLRFGAQLAQQKSYWGRYSPMIGDYTERGLQDLLGTERGRELVRLVDPFESLSDVKVPTLVLTGTNDPFWSVDSTQIYWDAMAMPKWSIAIPNAGHEMGEKSWWAQSLGIFARACVLDDHLPRVSSRTETTDRSWKMFVACEEGLESYRVWRATSHDMHFESAKWSVVEEGRIEDGNGRRSIWVSGHRATTYDAAVLVELMFSTSAGSYRLTTPVYVARKR